MFTRHDIELVQEKWLTFYNDHPSFWCKKDAQGNLIKNQEGKFLKILESETEVAWVPLKYDDLFVYLYCYRDENSSVRDSFEEWYIAELTDTAILLHDDKEINAATCFVMIPLERIAELSVGAG